MASMPLSERIEDACEGLVVIALMAAAVIIGCAGLLLQWFLATPVRAYERFRRRSHRHL